MAEQGLSSAQALGAAQLGRRSRPGPPFSLDDCPPEVGWPSSLCSNRDPRGKRGKTLIFRTQRDSWGSRPGRPPWARTDQLKRWEIQKPGGELEVLLKMLIRRGLWILEGPS